MASMAGILSKKDVCCVKPNIHWYLKHVFSIRVMEVIGKPHLAFSPEIHAAEGFAVHMLQDNDIPELMAFHDSRCIQRSGVFSREEVHIRLESGWACFCVRSPGSMAGFVWFAPRRIYSPDLHCEFEMGDRSVMITNGFVAPEHRGRNVFPTLMNESFRVLAELGCNQVYGFVRHENRSSKKALAKHGFQTFGIIIHGFAIGVYCFLPLIRDNAGIRVRLCAGPWHRWQEILDKRFLKSGVMR
jgi:ribosomal protein S18 acetylase RimI-like enzyme